MAKGYDARSRRHERGAQGGAASATMEAPECRVAERRRPRRAAAAHGADNVKPTATRASDRRPARVTRPTGARACRQAQAANRRTGGLHWAKWRRPDPRNEGDKRRPVERSARSDTIV